MGRTNIMIKGLVLIAAMLFAFTVTTKANMPAWIVNNNEYYLLFTLLAWSAVAFAAVFMIKS